MKTKFKIIAISFTLFILNFYTHPAHAGKSYFSLKNRSIAFEAESVTDTVVVNTKKIKKKKAKGIKPQDGIIFNSDDLPAAKMFLSPLVKSRKRLKIVFIFKLEKGKSRLKGTVKNVKLRIKKNGNAKIIVPQDEGIERSVTYELKSPSLPEPWTGINGYLTNDSQGPLITDGAELLQFSAKVFKDKIVEDINKIKSISDPQLSGTFDLTISIKGTNFAIETDAGKFKKVKIFKGKIEIQ